MQIGMAGQNFANLPRILRMNRYSGPSSSFCASCSFWRMGMFWGQCFSHLPQPTQLEAKMVIMLHAMNNITACFLKTMEMDELSVREIISNDKVYWVVYGVSALVTLVALWRMTVAVSRLKSENIEQKK